MARREGCGEYPAEFRHSDPGAPDLTRPEWQGRHLGVLALWLVFSYVLSQWLLALWWQIFPSPINDKRIWSVIAAAGLTQILFVAGIIALAKTVTPQAARVLNLEPVRPRRFFILATAGVTIALFFNELTRWFPPAEQTPIQELLKTRGDYFIMGFFAVFISPMTEEVFFRGTLFPFLAKRLPRWIAMLLVTLLFAALHGPQLKGYYLGMGLIFIIGFLLTAVRAVTHSTTQALCLHLFYNLGFVLYNLTH